MEKDFIAIVKDGFNKVDIEDIRRNMQTMVDRDGSKNLYYRICMWTFFYCVNMGIISYDDIKEYLDPMDIEVVEAVLDSFVELSDKLGID